jgi:hypothetical protein
MSDLISEQLQNMDLLTADVRDSLKFKAYNEAADEDILPVDIVIDEGAEEKDEWDLNNME